MGTVFNAIIAWSMRHKITVLLCSGLIMVLGVWSLMTMKIDILPDVNKPTVTIFAEADGLASQEVERLVVSPIEWAVSGTPGTENIRSTSLFGLGIVNVEFAWGSDVYRNRQIIQERLAQVNLPQNIKPILGPISSVMGEIMWVGLTSPEEKVSPMELRTLADWTLRPALLRIQGVSNVLIMGGDVKEWQINVNAERLSRYGMSLEDVRMKVEGALKNRGGGILYQNEKEYPIRIISAPGSAKDIEAIAIGIMDGTVIRLSDIAKAEERPSIVRGTAAIDGQSGVIMRIVRQPDAETLSVTRAIDETLRTMQSSFPPGVEVKNDLLRQEWFVRAGLKNVTEAFRDGIIILIIILSLFLMNTRVTAITLVAIPLSVFISAIVFKAFGFSVNVMTLGGIAVAIGELVDDAIVGIENVYRRLREKKAEGIVDRDRVIYHASSEVRNSIVYATLLVAVAFVPLFLIPGVEGRLLSPLGAAYIISLVASMVVSLTVTPVLCSYVLRESKKHHTGDTRFVALIKQVLTPAIRWSMNHPMVVIAGVVVSLVISAGIYVTAGKEGIPPFNEGSATIMTILPEGTNLTTTNDFVTSIEEDIMNIPGVLRVSHSTGRATADSHGGGSNSSEMQVVFKPGLEEKRKELFKEIQEVFDRHPGAEYSLGQPITHRLEQLISGVRAPIVIKVYGDDLVDLGIAAEKVKAELSREEGIKNPRVQRDVSVPEVRITPLANRLAEYGVSSGVVAEELEMGFMGEQIGQVPYGNQRIPVVLRYDLSSRGNAQAISDLPMPFSAGESLAGSVADIRVASGRNRYSHEGGKRVLIVSANYQGRDVVGAIDNVKKRIESIGIPTGTYVSYEGTYKSQKENSRRITIFFFVGLAAIFGILFTAFRSLSVVTQIMLSIPTVFIGGLIGVWMTGNTMSLAHMIGFVSLTGIVSRNGIMLISRALSLVRNEGHEFNQDTILKATLERVTPVLMTSSVTALALLPLMVSEDKPGKELLYPLAIVIFGGLVSSTIISLLLIPAVFFRFGKKAALESKGSIAGF